MGHNPNFVSELVQMAKAFEELPIVQGQLAESRQQVTEKDITIHELELKLIDLTNALDAANSATHKAEVERDHAESMFLESDDKLARAKDVFKTFIDDANDYLRAVEPQAQPEPVNVEYVGLGEVLAEPIVEPEVSVAVDPTPATTDGGDGTLGQSESPPITTTEQSVTESIPTTSAPTVEASSISEEAPHPVDPTVADLPVETGPDATSHGAETTANVSAPTTTEQSSSSGSASVDDVGYHNEPIINHAQPDAWSAWDAWCQRMNARYGSGQWPARHQAAQ